MTRTRKTPDSWIKVGLAALKKSGAEGLKAEALARDLGATKGSFYWHFKDVAAFHDAVLATWSDAAVARFDAVWTSHETPIAQLRALANFAPAPVDRAARGWAVHSRPAQKAVAAVDAHCRTKIAELLAAQGATHPDFPDLVYAAIVNTPAKGSQTETLIDLLMVLK